MVLSWYLSFQRFLLLYQWSITRLSIYLIVLESFVYIRNTDDSSICMKLEWTENTNTKDIYNYAYKPCYDLIRHIIWKSHQNSMKLYIYFIVFIYLFTSIYISKRKETECWKRFFMIDEPWFIFFSYEWLFRFFLFSSHDWVYICLHILVHFYFYAVDVSCWRV